MVDAIAETLELYSEGQLDFFETTTERAVPHYDDPQKEALSLFINSWPSLQLYPSARLPFLVLEADQEIFDEASHLRLSGYYELFDGVRIDVVFTGEYGDPSEDRFNHMLKPENCFRSFDFKAKIQNANSRQIGLFSQIEPPFDGRNFYNGVLHESRQKDRFKSFDPSVSAELHHIVEVGRLAQTYEHLHDPNVLGALAFQRQKFIDSLLPFGESPSDIQIKLKEAFTLGGGEVHTFPYAQFGFTRRGAAGIVAVGQLPNEPYLVTFKYRAQLAKENSTWSVSVRGGQLMAMINLPYEARLEDIELAGDIGAVASTLDVLMKSLMVDRYNPDDSVDNTYAQSFDHALQKAREEIKQMDPDYEPLVPIFAESNRYIERGWYLSDERLEFISLEAFSIFEGMLNLLRKNPQIGFDGILSNPEVQARMEKEPQLKRRMLVYYDCYQKDPKEAWTLFNSLDPAYARAEEINREEEEETSHSFRPSPARNQRWEPQSSSLAFGLCQSPAAERPRHPGTGTPRRPAGKPGQVHQ